METREHRCRDGLTGVTRGASRCPGHHLKAWPSISPVPRSTRHTADCRRIDSRRARRAPGLGSRRRHHRGLCGHQGGDCILATGARAGVLDETITLFRDRAAATCLGREPEQWGGRLVLIYVLRCDTRPFVCWYGYPPTGRLDNRMEGFRPGVKADLTQVSERLRTFYTRIHNRFRLIGWDECGLTPLDEMFTLDGDAAHADGYVWLAGRKKDLIIRGAQH